MSFRVSSKQLDQRYKEGPRKDSTISTRLTIRVAREAGLALKRISSDTIFSQRPVPQSWLKKLSNSWIALTLKSRWRKKRKDWRGFGGRAFCQRTP